MIPSLFQSKDEPEGLGKAVRDDSFLKFEFRESVAAVEAVGMWESRSDFQALWEGPEGLSTERHFHRPTAGRKRRC